MKISQHQGAYQASQNPVADCKGIVLSPKKFLVEDYGACQELNFVHTMLNSVWLKKLLGSWFDVINIYNNTSISTGDSDYCAFPPKVFVLYVFIHVLNCRPIN